MLTGLRLMLLISLFFAAFDTLRHVDVDCAIRLFAAAIAAFFFEDHDAMPLRC